MTGPARVHPDADGHAALQRLSSRVVYQNAWMTVREDTTLRTGEGSTGIYGVIDKPDFALVVPMERGGFHLVEQYRYPVGRRCWEFPQGAWPDRGDGDPAELARRELAVETGLAAGRLTLLGRFDVAHGMSSQRCNAFLATDLTQGPPDREPEEQDMRQRWVTRAELERMLRTGAITDGNSLAAYTLLLLHERG